MIYRIHNPNPVIDARPLGSGVCAIRYPEKTYAMH